MLKKTIFNLILLTSCLAASLSAKDVSTKEDLTRSRDVRTGFVNVPARVTDQAVPAAEIFYRFEGEKRKGRPTLVLIPGTGLSSNIWHCQQKALGKSFRTLSIDPRGTGKSTKTDPTILRYNSQLFADDLHVVLQTLKIDRFVYVGHSDGTWIGMQYEVSYPGEISQFVLTGAGPGLGLVPDSFVPAPGSCCNPSSDATCWPFPAFTISQFTALGANIAQIGWKAVLTTVLKPVVFPEKCQKKLVQVENMVIADEVATGSAIFANIVLNSWTQDYRSVLPTLTMPILLLHGSSDELAVLGASVYIRNHTPNSVLIELYGKGHFCMLTDASKFNSYVKSFVTGNLKKCEVCPVSPKIFNE